MVNYSSLISETTGAITYAGLKSLTSKTPWKGSVIGSIGKLPFVCSRNQVLTFSDLSRENSGRWAKHEVIGKKPLLEYIGPDLSKISLTIRFDTSLGVPPLIGLKILNQMLKQRRYYTMIIGGEHYGRFVLKNVSETRKFFTGAGVCLVAIATIELEEYGK